MTAPPTKPLRLTRPMACYDFSKEPLFGADIVIDQAGRLCKNRKGKSGGDATTGQLAAAEEVGPNR